MVVKALSDRTACLLANHGMIATGPDLKKALWLAVEVETLARQYFNSLLIGGPNLLSSEQIQATIRRFESYGQTSR
jgi:L-fuculose-phosphate aldolase